MCYSIFVILVRKLIWDTWNLQHIARHQVTPEEVEAACYNDPLVLRGQQKGRLVLIGKTNEERILGMVVEGKGYGKYYVVTAYDVSITDKVLYKRLRGGEEKNEEKE